MKRKLAVSLFALSTLATSATVLAQAPAIKANVPFEFTVADKIMPAGNYIITSAVSGIVQLRGVDPKVRVSTAAVQGIHPSVDQTKLVFFKYGSHYFLHQVLSPNTVQLNVNIPPSRLEKEVRTQEAKLAGPEQIMVAAK